MFFFQNQLNLSPIFPHHLSWLFDPSIRQFLSPSAQTCRKCRSPSLVCREPHAQRYFILIPLLLRITFLRPVLSSSDGSLPKTSKWEQNRASGASRQSCTRDKERHRRYGPVVDVFWKRCGPGEKINALLKKFPWPNAGEGIVLLILQADHCRYSLPVCRANTGLLFFFCKNPYLLFRRICCSRRTRREATAPSTSCIVRSQTLRSPSNPSCSSSFSLTVSDDI